MFALEMHICPTVTTKLLAICYHSGDPNIRHPKSTLIRNRTFQHPIFKLFQIRKPDTVIWLMAY